ncbi:MAG: hypothetical protein HDR25_06745 [Lachnospiraceae bacterium]|nr:hypothetical protein [Lachnospiraceae bacterium]
MRVISMMLAGREIARVEEGEFRDLRERRDKFDPNLQQWYDDCFYSVPNSTTFEERLKLVKDNHYFCYSKPDLKLIARTI